MNNLTVSQAMQKVLEGKVVQYGATTVFLDSRQFHIKVGEKIRNSSNSQILFKQGELLSSSLYYNLAHNNKYEFKLFNTQEGDV